MSHFYSRLHIIFSLFLVELPLLLCGRILILLILTHKIVHVALSFGELHLIHPLACVPVKERLAAEHRREVLSNTLEHFLNGCRVSSEGQCHLQALGRNVTDARFDVVWNPLHEIGAVLILHIEHLFIHLLRRHPPAEESRSCEIATMTWISSTHHVFGIEQ